MRYFLHYPGRKLSLIVHETRRRERAIDNRLFSGHNLHEYLRIWGQFPQCFIHVKRMENDKKRKLELDDVVEHQMKTYKTSLEQNNSIYSDTAEAIEKMIDLNILHCTHVGKTE